MISFLIAPPANLFCVAKFSDRTRVAQVFFTKDDVLKEF